MKKSSIFTGVGFLLVAATALAWDGWREVGGDSCKGLYYRSDYSSVYTFLVQFKNGAEKLIKYQYHVGCFCGRDSPRAVADYADVLAPGVQSDVTTFDPNCDPMVKSCSLIVSCSIR